MVGYLWGSLSLRTTCRFILGDHFIIIITIITFFVFGRDRVATLAGVDSFRFTVTEKKITIVT